MKPHHNSEQFVCNIMYSYNSFDLLLRCNVVHIQIKYLFKSHSKKNMFNLLEGNDLVNKNSVQQYFPFIKEIYRLYKQKPQPYKNNMHNGILFY